MTTKKIFLLLFFAAILLTFTNCGGDEPVIPPPLFPNMVFVEGGTFAFGSAVQNAVNPTLSGDIGDAGIATAISSFYLADTPITQKQYAYIMGFNPSFHQPAHFYTFPVEMVTWYHAIAFANRLSVLKNRTPVYDIEGMTNNDWRNITHADVPTVVSITENSNWLNVTKNLNANGFRLPTEVEWEFAARGGVLSNANRSGGTVRDYFFSNGNNGNNVWHSLTSGGRTHPVKQHPSNALNLYDMSGSIWEWLWCEADAWDGDEGSPKRRVVRGGCAPCGAVAARVSNGGSVVSSREGSNVGFRFAFGFVE